MVINTNTTIMGIIGNPLEHSLSPLMHNQVMKLLGYNGIYLPFQVDERFLGDAIMAIRALKIRGVNITIPFKEKVLPFLDELTPYAQACQAVNLIENREGRLIGHNLDGEGFMRGLRIYRASAPGTVLILGAGGAARAVSYELSKAGAKEIVFLARNLEKAKKLADFINMEGGCASAAALMGRESRDWLGRADLIVNCTPVGMLPHVSSSVLTSLEGVKKDAILYDIVYNPLETKLLSLGRAQGLKTVDGLWMLVYQGALSFALLTGIDPPVDYMRSILLERLKGAQGI
ncbi:MAG: shikimate dehydrogenase [Syntrophomonadaceae bacterium]|jgi:shikimate dehydrogenase